MCQGLSPKRVVYEWWIKAPFELILALLRSELTKGRVLIGIQWGGFLRFCNLHILMA